MPTKVVQGQIQRKFKHKQSLRDTLRITCDNPHKASGSDCIPGIVLQCCASVLAPHLARIINMSLSSGTVPAYFELSYVSPLFKSGDTAVAGNYRPVSLLPIVSRLQDYCVKKQIMAHLQDHHLLPASHFAYHKPHSTEDALDLAVNRWLLARSQRQHTGVIMVDMSKVFDRVQHQHLITVLHQHGIGGTVLSWLTSYLSNRRQQIKVADILSAPVDFSRGVPQGSVLGPLLFVLYTSELSAILPMQVSHFLTVYHLVSRG